MQLHLKSHDPAWAVLFQKTKKDLEAILEEVPYQSIEHVGSTSVPGLLAKPVLDVDIIVKLEQVPAVRKALSGAGYYDCGECGVPGRFQFRQPGYGMLEPAWGQPTANGEMRRNTYAMVEGCANLRNHLDVKRVLLEDTELRNEYGEVKKSLLGVEFENMSAYGVAKADILNKLLRKAGWTEEDFASRNKSVGPEVPAVA